MGWTEGYPPLVPVRAARYGVAATAAVYLRRPRNSIHKVFIGPVALEERIEVVQSDCLGHQPTIRVIRPKPFSPISITPAAARSGAVLRPQTRVSTQNIALARLTRRTCQN
jgi:hypothetical protein